MGSIVEIHNCVSVTNECEIWDLLSTILKGPYQILVTDAYCNTLLSCGCHNQSREPVVTILALFTTFNAYHPPDISLFEIWEVRGLLKSVLVATCCTPVRDNRNNARITITMNLDNSKGKDCLALWCTDIKIYKKNPIASSYCPIQG